MRLEKSYSNEGLNFLEADKFAADSEWLSHYVKNKDNISFQVEILRSGLKMVIESDEPTLRLLWRDFSAYQGSLFNENVFQKYVTGR